MRRKELYIQNLFDSIAKYYDIANTFLSFGRDRYWRRFTAQIVKDSDAKEIIDLCTGTGKLSLSIAQKIPDSKIIGLDFSKEMLEQGKKNLLNFPNREQITFQYGNAMKIPFEDDKFDCATMAFSLRNVDDIFTALSEMKRVVCSHGVVISLELSKPENPLFRSIYYTYFYHLLPSLGELISREKDPYNYLPDSLTHFPDRFQLEEIFRKIGLKKVRSYPLTGGIVALHVGEKEK
ncbi:MAG: bifunctional demethylmenaquinone methyltransferase/2-methoxy-6-polyprenyl-1,4-benzoquinol methylase UbiE [Halanaerobiales bacterium]|nr:bifunctional demethylmenaquinone methyltransferase/2-methoxy-6-polyprenyl-1,4-benzoquinol methylase UbiE [Halanaerobiales bacterium]